MLEMDILAVVPRLKRSQGGPASDRYQPEFLTVQLRLNTPLMPLRASFQSCECNERMNRMKLNGISERSPYGFKKINALHFKILTIR